MEMHEKVLIDIKTDKKESKSYRLNILITISIIDSDAGSVYSILFLCHSLEKYFQDGTRLGPMSPSPPSLFQTLISP